MWIWCAISIFINYRLHFLSSLEALLISIYFSGKSVVTNLVTMKQSVKISLMMNMRILRLKFKKRSTHSNWCSLRYAKCHQWSMFSLLVLWLIGLERNHWLFFLYLVRLIFYVNSWNYVVNFSFQLITCSLAAFFNLAMLFSYLASLAKFCPAHFLLFLAFLFSYLASLARYFLFIRCSLFNYFNLVLDN